MNQKELLCAIAEADGEFVEEVLTAAIARKGQLYPNWEIRYLAQPKGENAREKQRYESAWRALTGGK